MRGVLVVVMLGCGVPRGALGGDSGASDAPRADTALDAPGVDAPGVDAPGVDAPGVDVPGLDAPLLDAPMVDVPGIDAPGFDGGPDACTEVACNTGLFGVCAAGTFSCAGSFCVANRMALDAELCGNGLDDDCDESVDEGDCINCDERRRDGRLYLFCTDDERAVDARDECQALSLRLVKIDDAGEQSWIETQINEIDGGSLDSWWIGLYDSLDLDVGEGGDLREQHRWWPEAFADPAPTYDKWRTGEPNGDDEDCVRIRNHAARDWTDLNCDDGGSRFPYICEPTGS